MRATRRVTLRDLPYICMFAAIAVGLLSVTAPLAASLDVVSEKDLQSIAGSIERVYGHSVLKGSDKLDILLRGSDGLHHLTQDDMSKSVPGLDDLRVGDEVTARVKKDSMGRDLEWFWELKRGGAYVLSYEQTLEHFERRGLRSWWLAKIGGAISGALLIAGFLLRRYFGGWLSAT